MGLVTSASASGLARGKADSQAREQASRQACRQEMLRAHARREQRAPKGTRQGALRRQHGDLRQEEGQHEAAAPVTHHVPAGRQTGRWQAEAF